MNTEKFLRRAEQAYENIDFFLEPNYAIIGGKLTYDTVGVLLFKELFSFFFPH